MINTKELFLKHGALFLLEMLHTLHGAQSGRNRAQRRRVQALPRQHLRQQTQRLQSDVLGLLRVQRQQQTDPHQGFVSCRHEHAVPDVSPKHVRQPAQFNVGLRTLHDLRRVAREGGFAPLHKHN